MKLVDADLLIDMFKNDIAKTEHYINTSKYVSDETKKRYEKIIKIFEEYIEIIEHLPVTYDADNVIEQLEEEIKENPYQSEYLTGLYKAIDIVKEGWIDDISSGN